MSRIRSAVPSARLLVVDDASPDGTGRLADRLATADRHVHVLHRPGKAGLGKAYVTGFGWALEQGFDVVVQMDADGSHLPEQIPALLAGLSDADLVIGSRWVPGGSVQNWPRSRQALSRAANAYARLALGIGVRDVTAGFRAWRRPVLESLDLASVQSQGYCFQVDLARRAVRAGHTVVEVPIRFVEREAGHSKMDAAVVREAMRRVTLWGLADRGRQLGAVLGRVTRLGGRQRSPSPGKAGRLRGRGQ